MKKILSGLLGVCFVLALTEGGRAQEAVSDDPTIEEVSTVDSEAEKTFADEMIEPRITAPEQLKLGGELLVSAETSKLISRSNYGAPSYSWDFGDGSPVVFGSEIGHTYASPGIYEIRLNVKQGVKRESVTQLVRVYEKQAVLITDEVGANLTEIEDQAAEAGVWLKKIDLASEVAGLSEEEKAINAFQENYQFIVDSTFLIFYTRGSDGVQFFSQFWNRLSTDRQFGFENRSLIQVSTGNLGSIVRLTQPAFEIMDPNRIYLTRIEALPPLFASPDSPTWETQVRARGLEIEIVDELSRTPFYLPFSRVLNAFIANGISPNVIYLLLSVPFIAFIISFARQFVGISTFGVLSPLMLTLSFLVLGLQFGLFVFLMVLAVSYIIRLVFDRFELMYIPKVSLLLSTLSLSFFMILGVAIYLDTSLDLSLTIFPMMVVSSISEKFLSSQSAEGLRNALVAAAETVLVSLLAYFFVEWDWLRNMVLGRPEFVLVPMIATIWLGRFTGLRVTEYLKFRSLLNEDSQE